MKHPMLAAVKFWAFAHLLSNGSLADVLLFGGFLAWAVLDRISLKRRPPLTNRHGAGAAVQRRPRRAAGACGLRVVHRHGRTCGCSAFRRLGSVELPTYADVQAAARRFKGHAHRTPVLTSHGLDEALGASRVFQMRELPARGRVQISGRLQCAVPPAP